MSVSHLPGPVVQVRDKLVRRCMACGALLVEKSGVPNDSDNDADVVGVWTWPVGEFVRVENGRTTPVAGLSPGDIPKDNCLGVTE